MTLNAMDVYRGTYRVIGERLPAGATSAIYEVHHANLKQHRILKRGVPRGDVTAAQLAPVFANEADILRRLEANGVFAPALFEYHPEVPELVMTCFTGPPLRWLLDRWLRGGGDFPDDARLARFARRLVDAVGRCHARGVVLVDLKPDNVLVEPGPRKGEGAAVLIDFGSAVVLDRPRAAEDYPGCTPGYAAPELLQRGAITPAADVWSLGAILYALFRREELGGRAEVRDFGDRQTSVPPTIQRLIIEMTAKDATARPTIAAVLARLAEIEVELEDPSGPPCPKCTTPLPARGAKFCPACTAPVSRDTKIYKPAAGSSDPIRMMYEADGDGRPYDAVYWAKAAFRKQPLTPRQRLTALEAAVLLPETDPFAAALIAATDVAALPPDVRQPFLRAVVRHVRLAGESFTPHRAALARGAADWPDDEQLAAGHCEALPPADREPVLRDALRRLPQSQALRIALGDLLNQTARSAEAVRVWRDAVDAGHRDPAFLCRVWWATTRGPTPDALATRGRVAAVLRTVSPKTVAEATDLLRVADADWRLAQTAEPIDADWRYDLAEAALALEPRRTEFQEAKAAALFDQQKYLLAIECVGHSGYTPGLREVYGKARYELGQFAEARAALEELTASNPTPTRYLYLVRTFARLGAAAAAREAVARGYRLFPADAGIRSLYEKLRGVN